MKGSDKSILPPDYVPTGMHLESRDIQLENGMRVLLTPMSQTNSVGISVFVRAGSRYEKTDSESGLSHFLEHLCFKGTGDRPNPIDISRELDELGGAFNAVTDREVTIFYGKMTANRALQGLTLLIDILRNSLLEADEIERERGVILEELAAIEDSPPELVAVNLEASIWHGQPHGREIAGTFESVSNMAHQDIKKYYRRQYVPNSIVVSVAGAIDVGATENVVRELCEDWEAGVPGEYIPHRTSDDLSAEGTFSRSAEQRFRLISRDTEQAHLAIGMPGLSLKDTKRHSLEIFSIVLGEGMSSRLFTRLREELGLCYDIHSSPSFLSDTGMFGVYSGVDPQNTSKALEEIVAEIDRTIQSLDEFEIDLAKRIINSRLILRLEDSRAVSSYVGLQAVLGLEMLQPEKLLARIESVSVLDIQRTANELVNPEKFHLSLIGPMNGSELLNQFASF